VRDTVEIQCSMFHADTKHLLKRFSEDSIKKFYKTVLKVMSFINDTI